LDQAGGHKPAGQQAKASEANKHAIEAHRAWRGKVQMMAKCPMRSPADLAVWYTPGVAAASRAVAAEPALSYELTNRANTVAIVSDGSRVLGLGDIGPAAAMPVMEGKAFLFKEFGGVDAIPLCVDAASGEEIVAIVQALAPSFGGINLEDISTPKCFRVLEALRDTLAIPVWHDDQQGSATVALAGLVNALEVVGKRLEAARIVLVGIGAANMAVYRLLKAEGADPGAIIALDSKGTLHSGRHDIADHREALREKWQVCSETNATGVAGGIAEALKGADACLAFSTPGPGVIPPAAVASMAKDAIIFACANPVPEIWPDEALAAGARIVATGRSDFPNQVNNSLVFPGLFRGVLDVRARAISDDMALAAAHALAGHARRTGLSDRAILPPMERIEVAAEIASAVGAAAVFEGVAPPQDTTGLYERALRRIETTRRASHLLDENGCLSADFMAP